MALQRLDEQFDLKPGTQLLPYMQRLLPALEGRFQALEKERTTYDQVIQNVTDVALKRINDVLIPATEMITEVTQLGFLLAPSSSSVLLEIGLKTFLVDEGPQRGSFTPSPYVLVERTVNITDYAIARMLSYSQLTGELILQITAWHGDPGPHTDWMISSTPGMADSTKIYHDEVGPWRDEVNADLIEVRQLHDEVEAAAKALADAGLDAQSFIRRDGTVPFIATQIAVAPSASANDATIPTSAWVRARVQEYTANYLRKTGDTMTGSLTLSGPPTSSLMAATKQYVDDSLTQLHSVDSNLTITGLNPQVRFQPSTSQQNRGLISFNSAGLGRWAWVLGDNTLETGGNAGANVQLVRYNDAGVMQDSPLTVNRASGLSTMIALNISGYLNVGTGATVTGDLHVYRSGSPTTGLIFFNQANSAYHYFDGANHQLNVGGLYLNSRGVASVGSVNCFDIYQNGYALTTWGVTNYGNENINGTLYTNGFQIQNTAPTATMYDTDWGPMYIHHNGEIMGFLNHQYSWMMYANYQGYIWSPVYGWIHDYVNSTANNYAWNAANYRYNQLVNNIRMAYIGDLPGYWAQSGLGEPYGGSCITGWQSYQYWQIMYFRFRQIQYNIAGGWYAVGYA